MRRHPALYSISQLLTEYLPQLPGRLRAVLALRVEGMLLGLNGCQDTMTLALAQGLRGPRNPHTLRRLQRELLYDDADRIDSWGPGQELEVEGCFAPLLQWIRSWWVPTDGRELAVHPRPKGPRKQDNLVALVISVVYRQHAIPVARHIVGAQAKGSWIDHFCRLLAPAVPATVPVHVLCGQGATYGRRLWPWGALWAGIPACATSPTSPFSPRPDLTRAGALADHGTGRPVGGHRAGFPRPASGGHPDGVAGLRSGAALGAADQYPGGRDGAHPVCLPQLD